MDAKFQSPCDTRVPRNLFKHGKMNHRRILEKEVGGASNASNQCGEIAVGGGLVSAA